MYREIDMVMGYVLGRFIITIMRKLYDHYIEETETFR